MVSEGLRSASDEVIREALKCADPMVLLGLLYHATAEEDLASVPVVSVPVVFSEASTVADPAQAERLRDRAFKLLTAYRDGKRVPPHDVPATRVLKAMSLAAGGTVPADELALHLHLLDLEPEPTGWGKGPSAGAVADFNVVVIGSGLAGINAAVQLKASAIPFTLLEKNGGVGGTWYQNRYPGARVDWPSRLYSHTFGISYPFKHLFAPRPENESYLRWCADRYDLWPHIELNTEVTELTWNEAAGVWSIRSRDEHGKQKTRTARAIISAIGLLERPSIPAIPGLKDFAGPSFHSSRFDTTVPLAGKRIAVIGTGASGMQMVPDLAPLTGHVTVFQRSPGWVLPVPGYRDPLPQGALWLDQNAPYYTNWFRFVLGWTLGDHRLFKVFEIDPEWKDPHSVNAVNHAARERVLAYLQQKLDKRPDLQLKCTPNYPIFGNRPIVDNGWFDALQRDNVDLVVDPIERITANGVVTAGGKEHAVDIIIFATGFSPNQYFSPIQLTGRGGVSINEIWAKDGPRAFWGITVPSFPNLFVLYGPNANPRNLGPVQYGEWAVHYFLECFKAMIENGWKSMEVTAQAYERFNAEMDVRLDQLVSVNARTRSDSYYVNEFGRSAVQSPWSSFEVHEALSQVQLGDYHVDRGDSQRASTTSQAKFEKTS